MIDTPDQDTPQPAPSHISPFERIRQTADDQSEYWSARELAPVLDYTQWRNFEQAIERAIRACRNSGQDPADHFAEVNEMVSLGSKATRKVKDYQLSRYACYLIIQNADPEKEIVALGQTTLRCKPAARRFRMPRCLRGSLKTSGGCICAASCQPGRRGHDP